MPAAREDYHELDRISRGAGVEQLEIAELQAAAALAELDLLRAVTPGPIPLPHLRRNGLVPAREDYAKLHANTSGPGHQGQTSCEAQWALDEIDRLRAWKIEAIVTLSAWADVWKASGRPGALGSSKAAAVLELVTNGGDQ
jgi:hypothetical protein